MANIVRQPDSTYPIVVNPYKIFVSRAGAVEVDETTFTITNVSDASLDLSLVSLPSGFFNVELPETIASGESAICKIKVIPEFLEQAFEKSFTVELSDDSKSRFTVPIQRRLIGGGATAKKNLGGK